MGVEISKYSFYFGFETSDQRQEQLPFIFNSNRDPLCSLERVFKMATNGTSTQKSNSEGQIDVGYNTKHTL